MNMLLEVGASSYDAILTGVQGEISKLLPIGIGIFVAMLGVKLMPKIVNRFLK